MPLRGIRILSLGLNLPGPLATERLVAFGARATKIEPPAGDPLRAYDSRWYRQLHRNIRVKTLDLKSPAGRRAFARLLQSADILITSQRLDSLKRLGVSWTDLHRRHSRLIWIAFLGAAKPHAHRAGHDLNFQAAAGLTTPPQLPKALVADCAAAEQCVSLCLALLLKRHKVKRGGFETVSLEDCARTFARAFSYGLTKLSGMLGGAHPHYRFYRTKDHRWIAWAGLEKTFQKKLAEVFPCKRHSLQQAFASKPARFWHRLGQKHDLPLTLVPEKI